MVGIALRQNFDQQREYSMGRGKYFSIEAKNDSIYQKYRYLKVEGIRGGGGLNSSVSAFKNVRMTCMH